MNEEILHSASRIFRKWTIWPLRELGSLPSLHNPTYNRSCLLASPSGCLSSLVALLHRHLPKIQLPRELLTLSFPDVIVGWMLISPRLTESLTLLQPWLTRESPVVDTQSWLELTWHQSCWSCGMSAWKVHEQCPWHGIDENPLSQNSKGSNCLKKTKKNLTCKKSSIKWAQESWASWVWVHQWVRACHLFRPPVSCGRLQNQRCV